jgi:hypothetical protein
VNEDVQGGAWQATPAQQPASPSEPVHRSEEPAREEEMLNGAESPAGDDAPTGDAALAGDDALGDDAPEADDEAPMDDEAPEADEEPSDWLTPEVRQRLMRQFEQWLDRMAAGEPPPAGLPPELLDEVDEEFGDVPDTQAGDFYSVFAALTKLSGEIGLQGRAFKQLSDALVRLPQSLEDAWVASAEAMRDRSDSASAGPSGPEALAVLFDLHERLERGLRGFDATSAGLSLPRRGRLGQWLGRLSGTAHSAEQALDTIDALREGYELALSRLDATFHQWSIQRVGEPGERFDPLRMSAVDVENRQDVEEGTVLEVYRSGYELHGQLLRTAQVKVARAPSASAGVRAQ